MRVLLDTHALLWAVLDPSKLTVVAAHTINSPANDILVSAASAWEISNKVRIGKLAHAAEFERSFLRIVSEVAGYTLLPITVENALRAGRMSGKHRDPFDRMLAAQALAEDIPILSNDEELDAFGVRRLW